MLEETHKEISDSIKYAERLQMAILPSKEDLRTYLGDGFVLFQPKDVVSGDFYWMQNIGDVTLFAAADCTGHGVPGALVSVVCSNALNRSVKEFGLLEPKDVLNKTREIVIETFAASGKDVMDGMDIALCSLDRSLKTKQLKFAGANNPLWIVSDNEFVSETQVTSKGALVKGNEVLLEYKGDKQPVGLYPNMKDFKQQEITLHRGDKLYLFTDGFADQFGGENGKKIKYKPFKKYILDTNGLDAETQKKSLDKSFQIWKGSLEQVDDVCIISVEY